MRSDFDAPVVIVVRRALLCMLGKQCMATLNTDRQPRHRLLRSLHMSTSRRNILTTISQRRRRTRFWRCPRMA